MSELERKIDARQALRVYQKIVEHGEPVADGSRLGELTASADFDGYTVTLTDGAVTVRVLFHSRVAIDASSARALETFVKRLQRIDEELAG